MNIKMINKIKSQGHPCRGCPYVFTRGGTDCIMDAVPGDCAWYFYKRLMGHTDATIPSEEIRMDCQHFFRQIFLGYFSDIVQAFDTLRKNVCGDDYTSLHNPIVLSSVLPAYGMFHSIQILFL